MTPFQKESKTLYNKKVEELKTRDWNKDWPSARREQPTVCSCGKRLEKAKAKGELLIEVCKTFPSGLESSSNTQWRIDCPCGICYIWSHPNVWIRTHRISELHMFVFDSGNLLKPYPIKQYPRN